MNSHLESQIFDNDIKEPISSSSKVKVALRIRPLVSKELIEGSLKCIECIPQTSQVIKSHLKIPFLFYFIKKLTVISISSIDCYRKR